MELSAKSRFLVFWSVLGAVAFLTIWNLPWRFQVNDDVIMMWLVSGAYTGTPEPYAVFLHPMLSWTFSELYLIQPEINWYGATWFLVLAAACHLLIWRISELGSSNQTKAFLAFFILTISIHLCIFPQFTLVAGFAAFASLAVTIPKFVKRRIWVNSAALTLFGLGIMIRWESVVLVGLGFAFYFIGIKGIHFLREKALLYVFFGFLVLGLVGSKWYWEQNSIYSEFLEFNKVRSGVIDHPIFRQEILDYQIEENSVFFFFSRWFFEGDRPTKEELIQKKMELDSKFFSWNQLVNSFQRLFDFQKVEVFKSFLIAGILTLFFGTTGRLKRMLVFFLGWILFFFVFNHFFLIQGRVIFLFFLCFLFPVLDVHVLSYSKWFFKSGIVICLIALLFHGSNFIKEVKGRAVMNSEFLKLNATLKSGMPLIFEGYQEHNLGIKFSAFRPIPFISTGWISRSIFQQKALMRLNLTGFEKMNEFALITPSNNIEILFPVYMNHTFGDFHLLDSIQTDNFILMQFAKK